MTDRLYYNASYQTDFDSAITDIVEFDGKQALILASSAFYPTSGGQPFDVGTLTVSQSGEVLEIVDVVAGDAKQETDQPVLHLLKSASTSIETGTEVHGAIDWSRRYDHMQQHSGQHLLSHALDSLLDCTTVAVHFGSTESTIDVQLPDSANNKEGLLSLKQIGEIEHYVSDVVYQNVPISAYFVDEEKLSTLPLRRPPKVTGQIRIVEIERLDYSACGGTHCRRTGELGPIKIVKQERQRGNVRLTFSSGHRALKDYAQKHQVTSEIASIFSNEFTQTPALVQALITQNKALEKRVAQLTAQVLEVRAAELWEDATSVGPFRLVAQELEDADPNEAKLLASSLQEREDSIILLVTTGGEKLTAIFARGSAPALHMGNLLRSTLAEFGGGGGGKEDFAQGGGIPASTATALLTAAVAQVQSSATSM